MTDQEESSGNQAKPNKYICGKIAVKIYFDYQSYLQQSPVNANIPVSRLLNKGG